MTYLKHWTVCKKYFATKNDRIWAARNIASYRHWIVLVCIGNSMISSDIWHKYHEWYFKIVIRNLKFETILKYHEWYLCQISRTNHAIICLYYYPKKVVIFTCRYFKLSWNTTSLSQSNCRNFVCSSISIGNSMICSDIWHYNHEWYFKIVIRNFTSR